MPCRKYARLTYFSIKVGMASQCLHPRQVHDRIDFFRRHDKCFLDNILFNLPYVEERYQKTLEVRKGILDWATAEMTVLLRFVR